MKSQHFPPIDMDLYVVNNPPTEREMKELNAFVEKLQKKAKKQKPTTVTKKAKKYEDMETSVAFFREPEPDLYAEYKPLTKNNRINIQAQKLSLIEWLLKLQDEKVLIQIEKLKAGTDFGMNSPNGKKKK